MYKKIISLFLAFCMSFGMMSSAFAGSKNYESLTSVENGIQKNTIYFGKNKLVTWDDGNYVYAEQYDSSGNLIESAVGNRNSKKVLVSNEQTSYSLNSENVVSPSSTISAPRASSALRASSFYKVATLPVINMVTYDNQTMYLYQKTGSASQTTYKLKLYDGSLANFAASFAVGLGVAAFIASDVIGALVAAGVGVITGTAIEITSTKTLAAKKYPLSYYGKDKKTGETSDTMDQRGYKYVINETGSNLINETYYDGLAYDPDSTDNSERLLQYIVPNLYGSNYEWDKY